MALPDFEIRAPRMIWGNWDRVRFGTMPIPSVRVTLAGNWEAVSRMMASGIGGPWAALANTNTWSLGPTWSLFLGLSPTFTVIRGVLCGSSPHCEEPAAPGTGQDCGDVPSVIGCSGSG